MEQQTLVAESGKKCPAGGIWKVEGEITTTRPLSKGETMPEYCGKKVKWRLLYQA